MTNQELIKRAREHALRWKDALFDAPHDELVQLANALEATLARLEAAEKVCEAVENMRDVSLDLKTALGLEHKVHEALDAWRSARGDKA